MMDEAIKITRNAVKKKIVMYLIIGFAIGFSLSLITGLYNVWTEVGKPVIYLYPEATQSVTVNLETDGDIFISDPQIESGSWTVTAAPSGELMFKGVKYPYLFYESYTSQKFDSDKGWVVPRSEVVRWFQEYLPKFGLNDVETKDFIDYWGINLPESKYYQVSLIDIPLLEKATKLAITPEPDTLIRVILTIKPLDAPVIIQEPQIITPERKGFVAVEWGVVLL